MDYKNVIAMVLQTLDTIEVKGRGNLDALLASMIALEGILKEDESNG